MILKMCAIYDRIGMAYSAPQFVVSYGSAIRSFGDEIRNQRENNPLNVHPDDFDLYSLGEYNDELGSFDVHPPKQIASGRDYSVK